MQVALIIALFMESQICDKSFFSNKIFDKLINLLMSLMIITKVGSDYQTLSSKLRCLSMHQDASIIVLESNR